MAIQFLELSKLSSDQLNTLLRRAEKDIRDLLPLAQDVIDQVRTCPLRNLRHVLDHDPQPAQEPRRPAPKSSDAQIT